MKKLSAVLLLVLPFIVHSQCVDTANVLTFKFGSTTYEVIKEKKTWVDAAACAVERGGKLAEINDSEEQGYIFGKLSEDSGIDAALTVAPDGGNASYVWIGGNDIATEGEWIWDGDNDLDGVQFWMGDRSGSAVGDAYTNWGNEPDDFGTGQDGLGLAITDWPLGTAGQWNDVDHENELYFVVEKSATTSSYIEKYDVAILLFPNPVKDQLNISFHEAQEITAIQIMSISGKRVINLSSITNKNLDVSQLSQGVYLISIQDQNGNRYQRKFVKR